MATQPTKHVYTAINAVQSALAKSGITKDRKADGYGGGYQFRSIDDVYNTISPLLAKNKLCIIPRVVSRDCVERTTAKGHALLYVTVDAEFDFVSAEDGSIHTARIVGEAMDSSDKATNKAMSAAYKYCCFQTFAIPTEGDNDADATIHEPIQAVPKQIKVPAKTVSTAAELDDLGDACLAMREADDIETLQKIFGISYRGANKEDRAELKAVYDKRKQELMQ